VLGFARFGVVLVVAGLVLVVVFGLWLVDLGSWGYGSGWVDAAIALLVAVAVLGSLGGQRPKRARRLAHDSQPSMRRSAMSCARC
jgi:protein-S-isoprenylcysteine O-methyltransferase Ste14